MVMDMTNNEPSKYRLKLDKIKWVGFREFFKIITCLKSRSRIDYPPKIISNRQWDLNHILMWDNVSTLYQWNQFLLANLLNLIHESNELNFSWKLSLLTKWSEFELYIYSLREELSNYFSRAITTKGGTLSLSYGFLNYSSRMLDMVVVGFWTTLINT